MSVIRVFAAYLKWFLAYGFKAVDWEDVIDDNQEHTATVLNKAGYLPYTVDNPLVKLKRLV